MTPRLTLTALRALDDNYVYLIARGSDAIAVDPGEAGPVLASCRQGSLTLLSIILTHHHADHIGGVRSLKAETGCTVIGPDDRRIRGIDQVVRDGEVFQAETFAFRALSTPGHTKTHTAYLLEDEAMLFTGDCLFCGGCGRIFEGTPQEMWESLQKLASLPEKTSVYCAHEYTEENLRFALSMEPANDTLRIRYDQVKQEIAQGRPTVPSTIQVEKETNPFLRPWARGIRETLRMETASNVGVFAELRKRKNAF